MRKGLYAFLFIPVCVLTLSGKPIWAKNNEFEFPPVLKIGFLETEGFVPYKDFGPIEKVTRVSTTNVDVYNVINQQPFTLSPELPGGNQLSYKIFDEDHWIKMPPGAQIARFKDKKNNELWIYPRGLTFVHCIYFHENKPRLFECRFEEMDQNGKWNYATYTPSADGKNLNLSLYPENLNIDFYVNQPDMGDLMVRLEAIPHSQCILCHVQEDSKKTDPTPCGFVPGMHLDEGTWIQKYVRQIGNEPFTDVKLLK